MPQQHLQQAGLCQDCLNQLGQSIALDPDQQVNLTWCPHRQTMAKASIREGVVVGWEFKSPVTEAEARELFEKQSALANPTANLPWRKPQ
jgi:hypothetical protein